jgi:hypothetical protein
MPIKNTILDIMPTYGMSWAKNRVSFGWETSIGVRLNSFDGIELGYINNGLQGGYELQRFTDTYTTFGFFAAFRLGYLF